MQIFPDVSDFFLFGSMIAYIDRQRLNKADMLFIHSFRAERRQVWRSDPLPELPEVQLFSQGSLGRETIEEDSLGKDESFEEYEFERRDGGG
jgi:hypothetical protein